MNNIQKAFKNKAKLSLRMAAGGLIDPVDYSDNSIAGLQKRTAAVQSASSAPSGSVALMPDTSDMENAEKTARWRQDDLLKQASYSANPEPLQRAAAASATPLQIGQMNSPTDALNAERTQRWRQDDLLDKTQYFTMPSRRGLRMAEGGIVRGEGGPTDDKVPMQVAGRNVQLSNTEAVLPAKTVQALGGPKAVEELIEDTNGKPPVKGGLRDGGDYATGVVGDQLDPRDLRPEFRSQAATPVIEPAANPGLEAARNTRAAGAMGAMPEGPAYNPTQPEIIQPKPAASPSPQFAAARAEQEARLSAQKLAEAAQGERVAAGAVAPSAPPRAGMTYTGVGYKAPNLSGAGLRAGAAYAKEGLKKIANPIARGLAVAGAGMQGYETGSDLNSAWSNDKADVPTKIAATLQGAGDVAGNVLSLGMLQNPVTGLSRMIDKGLGGKGESAMDMALEGSGRTKEGAQTAQAAAPVVKPAAPKPVVQSEPVAQPAQADEAKQAGLRAAGNMPGQNRQNAAVTLGDTIASEAMGDVADRMTGVSRSSDMGLRGMAQRFDAYRNNDAAREARNAQLQLRGDGARFEKDGNGKLWITNSGDFDGSTKMAYTDKNGNPTAIHTGSQQHLQGLRDAQNQRDQLAVYEQNRLKRNAGEDITDEGLRARSQLALDTQGRQAAELAKAQIARAPTALDIDKHRLAQDQFNLDRQKADNTQENAVRNFKASQSAQVSKLIDSALDTQSPTTGLKDDELKKAQARRADLETALYAAHKRLPGDDAEYAASLPGMMRQAKLSVAMRDAIQNRGWWNRITNLGRDPWQTLNAATPKRVGDNFVFDNNFSIPVKDVIGKDADLLNAYNERVNSR